MERILNELEKIFRHNSTNDSQFFYSLNGIQLLTKMLARILNGTKERPTSLTDRANTKLATVYELICGQHLDVSDYVLQSNHMIELLDILLHRLTVWPIIFTYISKYSDLLFHLIAFGHEYDHHFGCGHIRSGDRRLMSTLCCHF